MSKVSFDDIQAQAIANARNAQSALVKQFNALNTALDSSDPDASLSGIEVKGTTLTVCLFDVTALTMKQLKSNAQFSHFKIKLREKKLDISDIKISKVGDSHVSVALELTALS
jgi:hypothetical protein